MNKITFCINTGKNELNHIKLLFTSLEKNLYNKEHEIIVFVDSDNQNTFEWLLSQKLVFSNLKILKNKLPIPYGYQSNINEMFLQAQNEIVSYIQSDMVICRNYDLEILKHIKPNTVVCSTRIEPPIHPNSGEKITYDFGLSPLDFDLEKFTNYAENKKENKITEFFFAPFSLYKDTWNSIGGHNSIYRRSREDTDILTRLALNDTKIIQIWNALVYHFTCTSSRGPSWFDKNNTEAQRRLELQSIADQIEIGRFLRNWGHIEHSTKKRNFYNINAVIRGTITDVNKFYYIEKFFNNVYVDDVSIIEPLQSIYDSEHIVANKLLDISNEDWEKYKHVFNTLNSKNRIFENKDVNDDIVIDFQFSQFREEHFSEFLSNIYYIINQTDVGEYEYEYFKIFIRNKKDMSVGKIKIKNPLISKNIIYDIF
jgi:hypothetical protein